MAVYYSGTSFGGAGGHMPPLNLKKIQFFFSPLEKTEMTSLILLDPDNAWDQNWSFIFMGKQTRREVKLYMQ